MPQNGRAVAVEKWNWPMFGRELIKRTGELSWSSYLVGCQRRFSQRNYTNNIRYSYNPLRMPNTFAYSENVPQGYEADKPVTWHLSLSLLFPLPCQNSLLSVISHKEQQFFYVSATRWMYSFNKQSLKKQVCHGYLLCIIKSLTGKIVPAKLNEHVWIAFLIWKQKLDITFSCHMA